MSNSKSSAAPARQGMQPLTPEEKREQFIKAYVQKKASLAEGILYNLCQSCGRDLVYDTENNITKENHLKIVKLADEMSTEFMKTIYHQEVKFNETKEKTEE